MTNEKTPPPASTIDVPLLFKLWADSSLNRDDIARRLGVGGTTLQHAIHRYKLPPRDIPQSRREPRADPTPSEIEQRKAEIRARHLAKLRAETPNETIKRVACEEGRIKCRE